MEKATTYARQLDTTVAALGTGSALLDVEETKLAAGGFDDTSQVRCRVPAVINTACQRRLYLHFGSRPAAELAVLGTTLLNLNRLGCRVLGQVWDSSGTCTAVLPVSTAVGYS